MSVAQQDRSPPPSWAFLEQLNEAALVAEPQTGRLQLANTLAKQLFGLTDADQPTLSELLPHVLDTAEWAEAGCRPDAEDPLAGRGRLSVELTARRRGGELFPAEVAISGVTGSAGEPASVALFVRQRAPAEAPTTDLPDGQTSCVSWGTAIERTLRAIVPALADVCLLSLLDERGELRPVEVTHLETGRERELRGLVLRHRIPQRDLAPLWRVLQTGRPKVVAELPLSLFGAAGGAGAQASVLGELRGRPAALIPMVVAGRPLGVLISIWIDPARRPGRHELKRVTDTAARCAVAIASARQQHVSRQAGVMQDYYFSVIGHELRSPLASLKVQVEMLADVLGAAQPAPTRQARLVERLARSVDRLIALAEDLLEHPWPWPGVFPSRPREADVAELVRQVGEQYATDLGRMRALVLDVPSEPCLALIDVDRVQQILINLLDNAVKYSATGSSIRLGLRSERNGLLLTVEDEGIGLPPGAAQLIFEPFGRAPNVVRPAVPGTGLGLHICRIIVEQHGGRIWAESEGEGRGTRVQVWLPAAGGATASPEAEDDASPRWPVSIS